MKLSKVLLKETSDPNATGQPIGSARLVAPDFDLELSSDGNWIIVDGHRRIPRELCRHIEPVAEPDEPEEPDVCDVCGKPCASPAGLAAHRRKAHPEAA